MLKHKDHPQVILPISGTGEMFSPFLPDGPYVKEAVTAKAFDTEQIFRPLA